MFFARFMIGPVVLGAVLFSSGCDNTLALPPATVANVKDTVTLHALLGTPISLPSGFDVVLRQTARTDRQNEGFDIAFDIDEQDLALILTTGALGLSVQSASKCPTERSTTSRLRLSTITSVRSLSPSRLDRFSSFVPDPPPAAACSFWDSYLATESSRSFLWISKLGRSRWRTSSTSTADIATWKPASQPGRPT